MHHFWRSPQFVEVNAFIIPRTPCNRQSSNKVCQSTTITWLSRSVRCALLYAFQHVRRAVAHQSDSDHPRQDRPGECSFVGTLRRHDITEQFPGHACATDDAQPVARPTHFHLHVHDIILLQRFRCWRMQETRALGQTVHEVCGATILRRLRDVYAK